MNKPNTVDEYILNANPKASPLMTELRSFILKTIPDCTEKIAWNVPNYFLGKMVCGFAAYKHHISFGANTEALNEDVSKQLQRLRYKTGKKTIQIKFDQKIPESFIIQMIKECLNEG